MPIAWQTATQMISTQFAAAQSVMASAGKTLDASVGSVTLAMFEGSKGVALWLQRQIIGVLSLTRAATSQGADLDSWMADFSFSRAGGTHAVGYVTLSRVTPTQEAVVPVGNQLQAGIGGATFTITEDSSYVGYDPQAVQGTTTSLPAPGYVIVQDQPSINVPVQADESGSAQNVAPNQINGFVQSIVGVDSVTNPVALAGGLDPQSDDSFLAGFPLYINTRSRATLTAIEYAVSSVQAGLTYSVHINVDERGVAKPGHFVVYFDDGSGYPSDDLVTKVYFAVDSYRALAETFSVQKPTVILANVSVTVLLRGGYSITSIGPIVTAAIETYISSLGMEEQLSFLRLAAVAFNAHQAVIDVPASGLLLNSGNADIGGGTGQIVRVGTVAVSGG